MPSKKKPHTGHKSKALAKATRPTEGTLRVQRCWENLEESAGGREGLVEALQYSEDENGQRLLGHLEDPRAIGQSLRALCTAARVGFPALYNIYRDALKARAHTDALIVQSQHLPAIMEDTCEDALSRGGPCPFCDGSGQHKDDQGQAVSCLTCDGTGKLRKPGNVESRKLVFESAGLTGKRGPLVAVQNNWDAAGIPRFEDIIARKDEALEGLEQPRNPAAVAAEGKPVPEGSPTDCKPGNEDPCKASDPPMEEEQS